MWYWWIFRLRKYRKKLDDRLVDQFTETIEEVKLTKITFAENESESKYSSCTVYWW